MKKYCMFLVVFALLFSASCTSRDANDLLSGVDEIEVNEEPKGDEGIKISDFGLRLLSASRKEGENTLLSPLSIISAMGMVSNGASGETLEEMEDCFDLNTSALNTYLYHYKSSGHEGLHIANAMWLKDEKEIKMKDVFLKKVKTYFNAALYQAPFDSSTKDDINAWVNDNTKGMVPKIINEIPRDAIVYLVNAIAFDKEWEDQYEDSDIHSDYFTTELGERKKVDFMYSTENHYIQNGSSKGVIKYYKGGRYAFVGILPNEGMTLRQYIERLNGESLHKMIDEADGVEVYTTIPVFEIDYGIELSNTLKMMGVEKAFTVSNDFNNMITTNQQIAISSVIHKTHIEVDQRGTKAVATTVFEMNATEAPKEEIKYVHLDRPFLYLIIDTKDNLPLFIGTVEDF